jgi:hypothetical protein
VAYTEQLSQQLALMDWILPTNAAAASYNSVNGVDMSRFKRALWVIQTGLFTANATLDARLQSSPNANFNVVHNIAGTNLTQVVNTTPNVALKMEVRAEYVQQQNSGDRYVRLNTTVGTAAVNYGALGFGGEAEQRPGAANYENTTTVAQTVVQ